jgi:pimeloyl-ACP methyl ester carboxylesterase
MHWYMREVEYLENLGYRATVPVLPHTNKPNELEWLRVIEGFAPDEETVLIGHSLGGTVILEFLEKHEIKVDRVILAGAPIKYNEELNLTKAHGFKLYSQSVGIKCLLDLCGYEEIYDWDKIRKSANSFYLVYTDDDSRVPLDEGRVLAKNLGAELSIVKGHDHCDFEDPAILNKGLK